MRSSLYLAVAFLLAGCGPTLSLWGGGERVEYVVGDTEVIACPDFKIDKCHIDYPSTIRGQKSKDGTQLYGGLYDSCAAEIEAFIAAQDRCDAEFEVEK